MNKAMSFLRLDFITIKPYLTLKNFLIFTAIALIMLLTSGKSTSAISMLMVYAMMYVSYPFAVGEKNGIDSLYTTLSIKRSTVVLGRYFFAIVIELCTGLLAYVFSFAVLSLMQKSFDALETLVFTLVIFLFFSIMQAFQLPIYFKLGYAKAKFIVYVPFLGLAVGTLAVTNFMKDRFSLEQIINSLGLLNANPIITALCVAAVWIGIMFLSYKISCSYYRKRDF